MGCAGAAFASIAVLECLLGAVTWLAGLRLNLPGLEAPLFGGIGSTVGTCAASVWRTRKRPPWVRLGPDGIELAGARGDTVFVAWPVVSSTRIRWRWAFARLEVTVTDPTRVGWASRGAGQIPQVWRDGAVTYWVDIGAMRGGPQRLEALLRDTLSRTAVGVGDGEAHGGSVRPPAGR